MSNDMRLLRKILCLLHFFENHKDILLFFAYPRSVIIYFATLDDVKMYVTI